MTTLANLDKLTININQGADYSLPAILNRRNVHGVSCFLSGHEPVTVERALAVYYQTKRDIAALEEANANLLRLIEEAEKENSHD
jgi:hypothetical protein